MSYGKYISECTWQMVALAAELEPADIEMLRGWCAVIGKVQWTAWSDEHREEISQFVAGDGAHRRRLKILDAEKHRRLALAAMQRVTAAKVMLTVLMAFHLEPKGNAPALIARAGTAFWEMFLESPSEWPLGGLNPFLDGSFEILSQSRRQSREE
jgi:hypothetical protein